MGMQNQEDDIDRQAERRAPPAEALPVHLRTTFENGLKGNDRGGELDRPPARSKLRFALAVDQPHSEKREEEDAAGKNETCQVSKRDQVADCPEGGSPEKGMTRDPQDARGRLG